MYNCNIIDLMEIYARRPNFELDWLKDIDRRSLSSWVEIANKNHPHFEEAMRAIQIQKIGAKVMDRILNFDENKTSGRSAVIMAIAHRDNFYLTPYLAQYGSTETKDSEYKMKIFKYGDYALFKTHFLIQHPEFVASMQNLSLPEDDKWKIGNTDLPGGAFAFKNGIIIGISGLSTGDKDTAAAITIGIAAKLISPQVAIKMAKRIGCEEFLQNRAKYMEIAGLPQ